MAEVLLSTGDDGFASSDRRNITEYEADAMTDEQEIVLELVMDLVTKMQEVRSFEDQADNRRANWHWFCKTLRRPWIQSAIVHAAIRIPPVGAAKHLRVRS